LLILFEGEGHQAFEKANQGDFSLIKATRQVKVHQFTEKREVLPSQQLYVLRKVLL